MLDARQQRALIELVRAVSAREIRPRFRRLDPGSISVKSRFDDVVTEADLAVEEAIASALPGLLPGVRVLGEERLARGVGRLDWVAEPGRVAVIDPIDGTWNFAHGVASHGVLLSVIEDGATCFGLLYDPVLDDWVVASRGGGAWFEQADGSRRRLATAAEKPLQRAVGFMQPSLFEADASDAALAATRLFGRCTTLRSACHEYRLLAQGAVDFAIHARPTPWDFSAGALAVTEAGGAVGFLDGRDYSPSIDRGCLVAASSEAGLERLREHLHASGLDV